MKLIKILHCADFHFDTPFSELTGSMGEKRKEDLRETFGRTVQLAKQEKVQLFLLGGDLFDNQRVSRMTINYLINKFKEIPEVHVFIAPGNHDPYHEKSYYHLVNWPDNVHIFQNTWEKVVLEDLNVCVYGRGFIQPHYQESFLKDFSVDDPTKINIMLLHGDVVAPGQSSDYHPITVEEIEASGLDYLALGHRHSCTEVTKQGGTFWAYSGCPEGRGFDELGEKGVLLGELNKESCQLSFRSIAKRKYFELKIDISNCHTYEEIVARVFEHTEGMEPSKNLFKVILQGEISEDFSLQTAVLYEKLAEQFYFLKIKEETTAKVDPQLLAADFTLRGLFARKMLERIERANEQAGGQTSEQASGQIERKRGELALKYGLRILEQGEAGIE